MHSKQEGRNPDLRASTIMNLVQLQSHSSPANPPPPPKPSHLQLYSERQFLPACLYARPSPLPPGLISCHQATKRKVQSSLREAVMLRSLIAASLDTSLSFSSRFGIKLRERERAHHTLVKRRALSAHTQWQKTAHVRARFMLRMNSAFSFYIFL